jgi:uncharacterized protein (TIGR02646 family)
MKHIVKEIEPKAFAEWREHRREEIERKTREGDIDAVFGMLQNPPNPDTAVEDDAPYFKNQLREELLREQGYICCYCTRSIGNSHTTKIEHFLPKEKGKYPEKVFTYDNLLVCCDGGEREKETPRELYCDTKKGKKDPTNPVQVISPFHPNCEDFFEFDEMGKIHAANSDNQGKIAIEFFGLDARALNLLREKVLNEYILNIWTEDMDIAFETSLLKEKVNGKFQPFCTAIISVMRNYP